MSLTQYIYKPRVEKALKTRSSVFRGGPHRRGFVYKIAIMSPRKPNSAKRRLAKIKLFFNDRRLFAKIPGIGDHFLQIHHEVLVRGHGPKDSPGINFHLVRGVLDFYKAETFGRKNRRSKFGLKKKNHV